MSWFGALIDLMIGVSVLGRVEENAMNWIRFGPVTAESIVLCTTLYLSCLFEAVSERQLRRDVQRNWGAIQMLHQPLVQDGVRHQGKSELTGPFDVWSGEWWRIPVTSLHHDNVVHLLACLFALWYLGYRLELRWGSFRTLLFLASSLCLPVAAELAIGRAMTGTSGTICAILGALVVLRQSSPEVAKEFSEEAAITWVSLIGLGFVTTVAGVWTCPNAAHLAGFCYGAAIAALTSGPLGHVILVRVSVVLAHAWVVPLLLLVASPFWIGQYQWYLATQTTNAQVANRRLELAVQTDPSLTGAWLMWSRNAEQQGDPSVAWVRLIKGLTANPSDVSLIDGTRRLWRHLDSQQRRWAEIVLAENFGKAAPVWLKQIRAGASPISLDRDEDPTRSTLKTDVSQFSLDQKLELPSLPLMPDGSPMEVPLDPDRFNDAVEGTLF